MVSESMLVAAAFPQPEDAEAAVKELGQAGFGEGDISLMYTDPRRVTEQGLVQGAIFGGVVGGLVGLLFPPVGIIVAAGPILGSLASALTSAGTVAVAGAALYGLTNALVAIGMPKEMADRFGGHVHKGDALVVVHTARDDAERARALLEQHQPRAEEAGAAAGGALAMPTTKQ